MAFGQLVQHQPEQVRPQFPLQIPGSDLEKQQAALPAAICCLRGNTGARRRILHPGRLRHKAVAKLGEPPQLRAPHLSAVEVCRWRGRWTIRVLVPCPDAEGTTLAVHPTCSAPSNRFPVQREPEAAGKPGRERRAVCQRPQPRRARAGQRGRCWAQPDGQSTGAGRACKGGASGGSKEAGGRCRAARRAGRCQEGWSRLSLLDLTSN